MEIGIDSFASAMEANGKVVAANRGKVLTELLERIEYADQCGLDVFGIGEHHRKEFLDSAPSIILAAAASRTSRASVRRVASVGSEISRRRCSTRVGGTNGSSSAKVSASSPNRPA